MTASYAIRTSRNMFSTMRQMTLRFCRLLSLVRANNTREGRARCIPLFLSGFCTAPRITWRTSGLDAGHVATFGVSRRGTNPKVLRLRLKERQLGADRSSHAVPPMITRSALRPSTTLRPGTHQAPSAFARRRTQLNENCLSSAPVSLRPLPKRARRSPVAPRLSARGGSAAAT
jgi:hypothetical protein